MKSNKVLLGILAGAAVGVLAGMLFAPDKGSKTRSKLINKGTDYADALKDQFNDLVEAITKRVEEAKDEADHIASNGKAKLHEAKKEVKHAIS
jgi:gas vesicle protein